LLNPFESGLSIESKFEKCGGLVNVQDDLDTSCQFVFNNQTDNLLFSKYPIVANETLYYKISPFSAWSVTYAEIDHPSFGTFFFQLENFYFEHYLPMSNLLGTLHAFCTHLVADQPFFDLSQESLEETTELIAFIQSKTSSTANAKIFLMGDFNAGPQGEDINPQFPDSYWYIRNSDFSDTQWLYDNLTGTPLECTYCSDNVLTSIVTKDRIFDHIFINNASQICVQNIEIFAKDNM
jgi:hypothetical protein